MRGLKWLQFGQGSLLHLFTVLIRSLEDRMFNVLLQASPVSKDVDKYRIACLEI